MAAEPTRPQDLEVVHNPLKELFSKGNAALFTIVQFLPLMFRFAKSEAS